MSDYLPSLNPLSTDRRALISCIRCRRLKKKCKQQGRARCQRCIETDQVCRYADLAEELAMQDRSGSVSPPASPGTKLIFPPVDYHDPQPYAYSPSPPPATAYLGQSQMNSPDLDELPRPHSQPPQLQPAQDNVTTTIHGFSTPNLDSWMTGSNTPSQYDNYVTPQTSSHLYPQQPSYNSGFSQNYSTNPYHPSSEVTPAHVMPFSSSPSKKEYVQDFSFSNYSYGSSQSNPRSRVTQNNAVASTSNSATPSYSNHLSMTYPVSGFSRSCQYCYQGYCTIHGVPTDDRMQQ